MGNDLPNQKQVSDNYLLTSRQPACVWDPAKDVQLHVVSSPDVS